MVWKKKTHLLVLNFSVDEQKTRGWRKQPAKSPLPSVKSPVSVGDHGAGASGERILWRENRVEGEWVWREIFGGGNEIVGLHFLFWFVLKINKLIKKNHLRQTWHMPHHHHLCDYRRITKAVHISLLRELALVLSSTRHGFTPSDLGFSY